MRKFAVAVLTLVSVAFGQSAAKPAGHYEGAGSPLSRWGAGANTFAVHEGSRHMEMEFTAAADGVGWSYPETKFPVVFLEWDQISGWCTDGEAKVMLMTPGRSLPLEIWDLRPENLATVLEKHLRRFAAESELHDAENGCTRRAFRPRR